MLGEIVENVVLGVGCGGSFFVVGGSGMFVVGLLGVGIGVFDGGGFGWGWGGFEDCEYFVYMFFVEIYGIVYIFNLVDDEWVKLMFGDGVG